MIQKEFILVLLLVTVLISFPIMTSGENRAPASNNIAETTAYSDTIYSSEYHIVKSDENELVVEFSFPEFSFESREIQSAGYKVVSIPGFSQTAEAGKPQLPQKVYLFGIPPSKNVEMEIVEDAVIKKTDYNIYPVPKVIQNRSQQYHGDIFVQQELTSEFFIDNSVNTFYPKQAVITLFEGRFRHQRVGALSVSPIQYNPETHQIRHHKKIVVKLQFCHNRSASDDVVQHLAFASPFENILKSNLINYDAAKFWKTKPVQPKTPRKSNDYQQHGRLYKIFVDRDGIYYIDKTTLDQAGINLSGIDPMNIKIFLNGIEIPIYVHGEHDGIFDELDYIEFFGKKCRNDYTHTNVYWLTWDETTPGKRMNEIDGSLADNVPVLNYAQHTIHFEKDVYYFTGIPNGEGADHWFWDFYTAPTLADLSFDLNHVADTTADNCLLQIEFHGLSDTEISPDHHIIVTLNGFQLLDEQWDGATRFSNNAAFSQSLLQNGTNNIRLNLPDDTGAHTDIIYLNYFDITYWRNFVAENDSIIVYCEQDGRHQLNLNGFTSDDICIFDISNYSDIKKINNITVIPELDLYRASFQVDLAPTGKFFATSFSRRIVPKIIAETPSKLSDTDQQADYIIITHEDFYSTMVRFQVYRENNGLKTKLVKITDIYDEFNHSIKNPRAIKDFLHHAFCYWQQPAPTYVLLVGDASYDYKDYLKTGNQDYVPTHLFESYHYNTETATDNWFACVAGDDRIPDIFIGRLAVQSTRELETIISTIIAYETNLVEDNWNKNALFIADKDDVQLFKTYSDSLIARAIPSDYNTTAIYLDDYTDINLAKTELIATLNNGCLITNYFGHGSIAYLAGAKILKTSDVGKLTNDNRRPFFISLSCLNGFFHHAQLPTCLAEALVKGQSGGAIGSFAPSGFANSSALTFMANELYDGLFNKGDVTLGSLALRAKFGFLKSGSHYLDHIDMYNLFGDPALRLKSDTLEQNTYASYYGGLSVRTKPAPVGAQLNAQIKGVERPFNFHVRTTGQYGPVRIPCDDPATPQKEGGVYGDSIRFQLVTTMGDTLPVRPIVQWIPGQHKIELVAIEDFRTSLENDVFQVRVDHRMLGVDFFDGDPLFNHSQIEIGSSNNNFKLNEINTRLFLNNKQVNASTFSCIPPDSLSLMNRMIALQLKQFSDGLYHFRLEIQKPNTTSFEAVCDFKFQLFSSVSLKRVLNYPNPMTHETTFTYFLVNDDRADVEIKIYTVAGRLTKVINFAPGEIGYNQITWNGRDEDNDIIANGIYFYKIVARSGNTFTEKIEKLIVMR